MTRGLSSDGATDLAVRQELARRLSRRTPDQAPVLTEDAVLADLGLGSLDLFELVDALETALAVNPFEGRLALSDVRTVGDLCAAYRSGTGGASPAHAADDLLERSRRRAEARRRGQQP